MQSEFFKDENLTCIIPCGGMGSRLGDIYQDQQKSMIIIGKKPLLGHIIDYWKRFTDNFIFITSYKNNDVKDYVDKLQINSKIIIEEKPEGIANALYLAKDYVKGNFILALGDCVQSGSFVFPEQFSQGIGVWRTADKENIKKNYSVELKENTISNIEEKPENPGNDLCGMGTYFLNKSVFDYIPKTKKSEITGNVEITDVIRLMIDNGIKISPVFFEGGYLNVTYQADLDKARKIMLDTKSKLGE